MSEFQAYSYPKEKKIETDTKVSHDLQSYTPHAFPSATSKLVSDTTTNKTMKFALDALVSKHLGLEAHEKQKVEAEITREIERRWTIAKEKAEVDGFTRGLEDGKKEAFVAETPKIKEKLDHLDNLLKEIDKMRFKVFEENEKFLMDILAHALRMVALKEISTDQEYLKRLILSLLEQIGTVDAVKITVCDKDMDRIKSLHEVIQKEFSQLSHTVIEHRPDLPENSCVVETKFNVIHASLEKQIANVMNSITEKK